MIFGKMWARFLAILKNRHCIIDYRARPLIIKWIITSNNSVAWAVHVSLVKLSAMEPLYLFHPECSYDGGAKCFLIRGKHLWHSAHLFKYGSGFHLLLIELLCVCSFCFYFNKVAILRKESRQKATKNATRVNANTSYSSRSFGDERHIQRMDAVPINN